MSEKEISNRIKLAASKLGAKIFNNPVGIGWLGQFRRHNPDGTVHLSSPSRVAFGLMPGSADLIGYLPVEITQEDVGTTFGVFVSLEVKRPGNKPTATQETWLKNAEAAGCIAAVLTNDAQVPEIIKQWREIRRKYGKGKR